MVVCGCVYVCDGRVLCVCVCVCVCVCACGKPPSGEAWLFTWRWLENICQIIGIPLRDMSYLQGSIKRRRGAGGEGDV